MSDEKIDSVVLADGYWKDIQDELNVQDYGRDVVTEDVLCEATIVIKVSTIVPVAYRKGERNEAAIRRVVMKEAQYRVDSERRGGGNLIGNNRENGFLIIKVRFETSIPLVYGRKNNSRLENGN